MRGMINDATKGRGALPRHVSPSGSDHISGEIWSDFGGYSQIGLKLRRNSQNFGGFFVEIWPNFRDYTTVSGCNNLPPPPTSFLSGTERALCTEGIFFALLSPSNASATVDGSGYKSQFTEHLALACEPLSCLSGGCRRVCENNCLANGYNCANCSSTCGCKCWSGNCFICI